MNKLVFYFDYVVQALFFGKALFFALLFCVMPIWKATHSQEVNTEADAHGIHLGVGKFWCIHCFYHMWAVSKYYIMCGTHLWLVTDEYLNRFTNCLVVDFFLIEHRSCLFSRLHELLSAPMSFISYFCDCWKSYVIQPTNQSINHHQGLNSHLCRVFVSFTFLLCCMLLDIFHLFYLWDLMNELLSFE